MTMIFDVKIEVVYDQRLMHTKILINGVDTRMN